MTAKKGSKMNQARIEKMLDVLDQVSIERRRQEEIHGDQSLLPNGTARIRHWEANNAKDRCDRHTAAGTLTFSHILAEEFHEAMCETDPARLREELIQVAAVAVKWIEAIDSRA